MLGSPITLSTSYHTLSVLFLVAIAVIIQANPTSTKLSTPPTTSSKQPPSNPIISTVILANTWPPHSTNITIPFLSIRVFHQHSIIEFTRLDSSPLLVKVSQRDATSRNRTFDSCVRLLLLCVSFGLNPDVLWLVAFLRCVGTGLVAFCA